MRALDLLWGQIPQGGMPADAAVEHFDVFADSRLRLLPAYTHASAAISAAPSRRCRFTDGIDRNAYEVAEGRQYVQDDDGGKVYGTWMMPADELDILKIDQTFT
jgi:hypothetical protein